MADDEVGPGADDGVREGDDVAARLAEEPLRPGPHVLLIRSFGAGVHRHHDDVGLSVGLPYEAHRVLDVEQALRPWVRREADERDLRPAVPQHGDLAGRPVKRRPARLSAAIVSA